MSPVMVKATNLVHHLAVENSPTLVTHFGVLITTNQVIVAIQTSTLIANMAT